MDTFNGSNSPLRPEAKKLASLVRVNSGLNLSPNPRIGLEYEASEKKKSRYAKKLTEYYLLLDVAGVFYVCGNISNEQVIRQIDAEVVQKFQSKIYTCQEMTTHNGELPLSFRDLENAKFSLK